MKYIVKNDKPWTDMVEGKYTVVNSVQSQYLLAKLTGTFVDPMDLTEFLPAVLPNQRLAGDREHAGVISTHAWLQRFPTTPTNRNRHRTYILAKQFLATDIAALAARPIEDGGTTFKMPTVRPELLGVPRDDGRWRPVSELERSKPLCQTVPCWRGPLLPNVYRSTTIRKTRTARPTTWTATTGSATSTRRDSAVRRCRVA
jgi:hypothetical protein